jgi:plastocyanin
MKTLWNPRTLLALGIVPAVVVLTAAACGGGTAASSSGQGSTVSGQTYTIEVLNGELATKFGIVGPDGKGHDSFVPSHMTVTAGVPVTITVYNYDEGAHTFTVPDLAINQNIPAAKEAGKTPSKTTFTVTFPKAGTFRWYCALPCDGGQGGWAMTPDRLAQGTAQTGFMAGIVTAL